MLREKTNMKKTTKQENRQMNHAQESRGGGTPILKGCGCLSKNLNKPLKETNLGVAH